MGTRVGDVDPGALTYLMKCEGLDADGLTNVINKKSGVFGISGISSDMRDIEDAIAAGNERAKLAMDMYEYRILKYIGASARIRRSSARQSAKSSPIWASRSIRRQTVRAARKWKSPVRIRK